LSPPTDRHSNKPTASLRPPFWGFPTLGYPALVPVNYST
jgi:hypothetical protein